MNVQGQLLSTPGHWELHLSSAHGTKVSLVEQFLGRDYDLFDNEPLPHWVKLRRAPFR